MKKLLIFVFCTGYALAAGATIRSVSNLDSSAQYSTIQASIDASSSGDSIYVSKSSITYAAFTIDNKKLAILGPGWSPFVAGTANVNGCTITGTGASGSELHGLFFPNGYSIDITTSGINNLRFYRNYIYYLAFTSGTFANYIIEGNWFVGYGINGNGATATTLSGSLKCKIIYFIIIMP